MSTTVLMHERSSRSASETGFDCSDSVLLDRYLSGGESDAEEAFRELMFRHGPMVLAVCRRALNGAHDAEEAFQATFLTLARKGATIRDRQYLAGWLCEVAHRIAIRSRASGARRRAREARVLAMSNEVHPPEQENLASRDEIRPIIQEEVHRLPEKYRAPVILSYFEGKSNEEVAELLKWPVGTVKGRLSRARELLRERFKRRGLALSAAFLLYALEARPGEGAEIDAPLLESTLRTSLGARTTARTVAPVEPLRRNRWPIGRRLLLSVFLLACATAAFGYTNPGYLQQLEADGLYEWTASLIPLPLSSAPHCH